MDSRTAKPLLRVLGGEILTPAPIWLMRQAGRYLPEYREVRARAGGFLDLCFNPELAAEVTLQPIQRFGFDAAILFADILLVPLGLGQRVWFEEGEGPRLDPVADATGLSRLSTTHLMDRVGPVFETVRRVKAALPREVALIGFAGAPWTVATYMIAGRGTPDQAPAKEAFARDPAFVTALNSLLVESTIEYLSAQVEAGCEVLQLFDTWAGGLSVAQLGPLVVEPTARIVRAINERYPHIPIIGFPRGIRAELGTYAKATGVNAVSLGTGDDPREIAPLLPTGCVLQGNIDPQVLVTGGPPLDAVTLMTLRAFRGLPHIVNLGHGILPHTAVEHVARLVNVVRSKFLYQ